MDTAISRTSILTAGLALFAMQFGAGNIVFALAIGHFAQDQTLWGCLGLILTGVLLPLLGLVAMTLFDGDYRSFFNRIGAVPGYVLMILILGLLGPFGAIPRCLVLSYSTSKPVLPDIPLEVFSLICCAFIFLLSFRRSRIMEVVGYYLTPMKLGSLLLLIVFGFLYASALPMGTQEQSAVFVKGFVDGLQPMDLLGAFFMCTIILEGFKRNLNPDVDNSASIVKAAFQASGIAYTLLAVIYIGFSLTAAFHSEHPHLTGARPEELVTRISHILLGEYGGFFVSFAVTLACLTTAIALSTVSAEFLHKDISNRRISYAWSLAITLAITFAISTLNFTGIVNMLAPVLALLYPTLVVLCIANILQKTTQFKYVKTAVAATFVLSLVHYAVTN